MSIPFGMGIFLIPSQSTKGLIQMNDGFINFSSKYQLLRDAVISFFHTLHEIIPCNTFFLAEFRNGSYYVVCASNAAELLVDQGTTLTLPPQGEFSDFRYLSFPVVLRGGRLFGQICALDRKHAFRREDVQLLERMADIVSRLIEAEESVFFDELTGVYRRKYAEALFYHLPVSTPKAVVFLDVDNFKSINDTYGHQTGDEVLKTAGAMIKEISEKHDSLAFRYAGDEFVIIVPDGKEEKVLLTVQELMDRLSTPLQIGGHSLTLSVSIGICMEAESLQEYIRRADAAMYQIKRGAKQGYQIYAG